MTSLQSQESQSPTAFKGGCQKVGHCFYLSWGEHSAAKTMPAELLKTLYPWKCSLCLRNLKLSLVRVYPSRCSAVLILLLVSVFEQIIEAVCYTLISAAMNTWNGEWVGEGTKAMWASWSRDCTDATFCWLLFLSWVSNHKFNWLRELSWLKKNPTMYK